MNLPPLQAIIEELHYRVHQGTCSDMHASTHRAHMAGFAKRAEQILHSREPK